DVYKRQAHDRLVYGWIEVLKKIEKNIKGAQSNSMFPRGEAPVQVVGYQSGTCRMGTDPANSVLDIHCRTHEIDNLYVVDSSFFPSCASVGPALTVIANALRVGDHLAQRLQG
ncbi:dehydrogenase, partial [filamentous cyanobacterium CCP5]